MTFSSRSALPLSQGTLTTVLNGCESRLSVCRRRGSGRTTLAKVKAPLTKSSLRYTPLHIQHTTKTMHGLRLRQDSGRLELRIFDDLNWPLFNEVAEVLEREFSGTWLKKINGLDQTYWDLRIGNSVLTLHMEHYLGIMLYTSTETLNKADADSQLMQIHEFLSTYEVLA